MNEYAGVAFDFIVTLLIKCRLCFLHCLNGENAPIVLAGVAAVGRCVVVRGDGAVMVVTILSSSRFHYIQGLIR